MKCKKKFVSFVLSLCMAVTATSIPVVSAVSTDKSASKASTTTVSTSANAYGLADNIQDGQILQCFNWSFDNIKKNMKTIADQGFTAVQTSPIQVAKESTAGKTAKGSWWVLYQPVDFAIENNSHGSSALGTASQFKAMCDEAHKYGVKVVVDAVLNHMGNKSKNDLSPCIPDEIRNNSSLWHDISKNSRYESRYDITQFCMDGIPDLNTSNKTVQNYAIKFLKECVDNGADGFRFDGAKHIETPADSGFGSEFWPTVLNATTSYAKSTRSITPFYYGEVLDGTTGSNDRSNGQTVANSYTSYMSITLSSVSNGIRNAVNGNNAQGAIRSDYSLDDSTVAGNKAVLWNESHDTYQAGSSSGVGNANMDKTWALVGTRNQACGMYMARPNNWGSAMMGQADVTNWANETVKAINQFKNAMIGQTEYLSAENGIAYNERGTKGVVLVNCGGNSSVSVTAHKMAAGTYTDVITGNTFTVANGKISGNIGSSGVAVVYNAKKGPQNTISKEGGSFKAETLPLTLGLKDATSGTYQIDNGTVETYTGTKTITIGEGVAYGSTITVNLTATDGTDTSKATYTFKKVDPTLTQKIYFDNSSYNWSRVYAYIYNDTDFLFQMIICNDFVKQHQVIIVKFAFFNVQCRFCIANHRIRKMTDKTSGKRRKAFQSRRAITFHNVTNHLKGIICLYFRCLPMLLYRYHFVLAGNSHDRVISHERIATPLLTAFYTFQQIITFTQSSQLPKKPNWSNNICINLFAHRHNIVFFCQFHNGFTIRYHHDFSSSFQNKKSSHP